MCTHTPHKGKGPEVSVAVLQKGESAGELVRNGFKRMSAGRADYREYQRLPQKLGFLLSQKRGR